MPYSVTLRGTTHTFPDLRTLLAKATPLRSGDQLAGLAADTAESRAIAQMALAEVPLTAFLNDLVVPYELDEVTRLIIDAHNAPAAQQAFAPIATLTVGELRDWLLSDAATPARLTALALGLTPEIVAAVSKLMRVQDLIYVASKCHVTTRFRTTIGLPGRLSTRLQPNHPTDDPTGIAASILDGFLLGSGDAVIGINPVSDSPQSVTTLLRLIDHIRQRYSIPTQSCVLAHITTQMQAIEAGAATNNPCPLDLLFQSIAGTESANKSFGINLALLQEAHQMALSLNRNSVPNLTTDVSSRPERSAVERPASPESPQTSTPALFYFETGQGSALSANAHHNVDQQTLEARAYAVARAFNPLLVNTVVGFIGPEYLYDGKQILRAGLEDHLCGKLLGLPMGCDICYTNHAEADSDDMDTLLTCLATAGVTYIMGVPGADDIMLNYQSTSFHDALYLRRLLGLKPAPEFEAWLTTDHHAELHRLTNPLLLLP
ncbi:ethanolamine ammonia lyase large subunit [Granulicella sp. 5B5]|uniref:ethanolamine ammonia-lyase subunit EutB n=1 Tax=Granulicella sp. 5B5 TaxID=1617967 RepID=UPI0015F5BCF4|nr:ethanolamine ammonia-lyase subunit EutB [Granulicella sp. 5B5]QMV19065.1 ethanolamine ammonia lyase large subunit [Granulicella sp. 5B5]